MKAKGNSYNRINKVTEKVNRKGEALQIHTSETVEVKSDEEAREIDSTAK